MNPFALPPIIAFALLLMLSLAVIFQDARENSNRLLFALCLGMALANGASLSLTVTYTVQSGYTGAIQNVATAASETVPDPDPENNESTVTTEVSGGTPTVVRPVPVDARWMLALMSLLLMVAGLARTRRS